MKRFASILLASLMVVQLAAPLEARGGRGFPGAKFSGSHAGYDNHYDNQGRWGRNDLDGYGPWGGWGRPGNRWVNTGWGGWYEPMYGVPGSAYDSSSQSVDAAGNVYPNQNYNISGIELGAFAGHSASETVSAEIKAKPAIEPVRMKPVTTKSVFKLGPDTDVLDNGGIAVRLNDDTFLLVAPKQTLVVDQKTGVPSMALYTDPLLLWNVADQLKKQADGLRDAPGSAQKNTNVSAATTSSAPAKGGDCENATTGSAGDQTNAKTGSAQTNSSDATQTITSDAQTNSNDATQNTNDSAKNIVALLDRAYEKLKPIPAEAPTQAANPAPDMVELFASVWALTDGSFIVYKQPDGSIVYMNDHGTFSDRGKTARAVAFPDTFETAVFGFLKTLVDQYQPTLSKLDDDKEDTEWALSKLAEVSQPDLDQIDAQQRLAQAVARSERRLSVLTSQIKIMPDEVDAAKKTLMMLGKQ